MNAAAMPESVELRRILSESSSANVSLPNHLLSLREFSRDSIIYYFKLAREFERASPSSYCNLGADQVAAILFFQQSLRTRMGFEAALLRLGVRVTGFADVTTTRSVGFYQESLEDVIRFTEQFANLIVMRHYETGAAARAAAISRIPIINGGDGYGEHPSQALGDLYHLYKHFDRLDGLRVGIVGSLKVRGFRSLVFGLSNFDAKIVVLPPPGEDLPEDVARVLVLRKTPVRIVQDMDRLLAETDVVLTFGVNQSGFDQSMSTVPKSMETPVTHRLTLEALERTGRKIVVMHMGPITDEIDRAIDVTPYAHYFPEARDGMWMRMAVIATLLERSRSNRD